MYKIEYRNYTDDNENLHKIPILTINKGTLLFRYVYDIPQDNKTIFDMTTGSFLGIRKEEELFLGRQNEKLFSGRQNNFSFCLPKHYNVFFYSSPYVMDTNKYLEKYPPIDSNMIIFETTRDLKVVLLIKPSNYYRIDKEEEAPFITTCDNYTYCDNLKGFYYDPCFKENFINQNLDIMGMYGISKFDSIRFLKKYNKPFFNKFKNFITLQEDSRGVSGPPELILYPYCIRSISKDISFNFENENDIYDYIKKYENDFNFKMINTFKHKPYNSYDDLYKFMKNIKLYYKFNDKWGFWYK